jgi:UDPglucose 6-dehydrogenase
MGDGGSRMKICVQGLWHLGTVTAGCLASVGHDVLGLDFDQNVIQNLQNGEPPIFEPGLSDLIKSGIADGKLSFVANSEQLTKDIELLWITYDTPVNEDDEADVEFVIDQVAKVFPFLPDNVTILISSQMPVGSIKKLEKIAQKSYSEKSLSFAYSPENLRLGKALEVFLTPDRIIVGVRSERDKTKIEELLRPITDRIEWMCVESAEMTKHAINAFLATSVVFANEIATVCEMVGADAKEVERGLKSEQRIGPKAYLSPGGAFAGGTLARDIEFLKTVSLEHQITIPLLESVKTSNNQHKLWMRRKAKEFFPNLQGVTVAVWGLTYKAGTDTLRRSLAVELCNWFLNEGAEIQVHDPAVKVLPSNWDGHVKRFNDAPEALKGAQLLFLGTEWPEYKNLNEECVSFFTPGLVVLDPNRFLTFLAGKPMLRYVAVGTPGIGV